MLFRSFKTRVAAGKSTELDVLQAEADLAQRRNGRNEAIQKLAEARSRAAAFMGSSERDARGVLIADAPPRLPSDEYLDFARHWKFVFDQNPDFVSARLRAEQDGLKLAYAKNQRLPQLDLRGSYGLNGLNDRPNSSVDKLMTSDYPSWSVGLEFRMPIGGDIRARNEYRAAIARHRTSLVVIKDMETQLANTLQTSLHRTRFHLGAIADNEAAVRLNQTLLQTEMARLDVGRVEARRVLEVERDLLIAKITALASVVQYRQSLVELEVLDGIFLSRRSLDRSRAEVQARVNEVMQIGRAHV